MPETNNKVQLIEERPRFFFFLLDPQNKCLSSSAVFNDVINFVNLSLVTSSVYVSFKVFLLLFSVRLGQNHDQQLHLLCGASYGRPRKEIKKIPPNTPRPKSPHFHNFNSSFSVASSCTSAVDDGGNFDAEIALSSPLRGKETHRTREIGRKRRVWKNKTN